MRRLVIDNHIIDDVSPPFQVCDIGHNGAGSVELTRRMVAAAKDAGASAVKFQTRTPKDMYVYRDVRGGYLYRSGNPQWMAETYGAHREALEFSRDGWTELFTFCRQIGITAFSTPFDFKSADMLESFDVPCYKIASGDATNIPLIRHVARFGKPVIVSTGGCTLSDVERIVEAVLPINRQLALLQCSCVYPAPAEIQNILVIDRYRDLFPDVVVGLSSHNPNWWVNAGAYMLGARIFENHFTTDRTLKGTDNRFSLTPDMLREQVAALAEIRASMGSTRKFTTPLEIEPTLERRKKVVFARPLPAGHHVTREDVTVKCPGDGLPPYMIDAYLASQPVLEHAVDADDDVPWKPEDHDGVFADVLTERAVAHKA